MTEKMLRLPEVAAFLGVSLHTVRRWATARKFPTARLGRTVVVPEAELHKWIKSKLQPPRP